VQTKEGALLQSYCGMLQRQEKERKKRQTDIHAAPSFSRKRTPPCPLTTRMYAPEIVPLLRRNEPSSPQELPPQRKKGGLGAEKAAVSSFRRKKKKKGCRPGCQKEGKVCKQGVRRSATNIARG